MSIESPKPDLSDLGCSEGARPHPHADFDAGAWSLSHRLLLLRVRGRNDMAERGQQRVLSIYGFRVLGDGQKAPFDLQAGLKPHVEGCSAHLQ